MSPRHSSWARSQRKIEINYIRKCLIPCSDVNPLCCVDKQLAPFCQLATQMISNQQIGVPATNIAMDNLHPFLVHTIKWGGCSIAMLVHTEIIPCSKNFPTYPWNIPQTPNQRFMKEFLSFGGLGIPGYAPRVCWGFLRSVHSKFSITSEGDFFRFDLSDPPKYQVRTKHHQRSKIPHGRCCWKCAKIGSKVIRFRKNSLALPINGLYVGCRLVMLIIHKSHFKHIQKHPKWLQESFRGTSHLSLIVIIPPFVVTFFWWITPRKTKY